MSLRFNEAKHCPGWFMVLFYICFSSVSALFSDVYAIQVFRAPLYFFPQTAKFIIHPASRNSHDNIFSCSSVNMNCRETVGNWQSKTVKGHACRRGGGWVYEYLRAPALWAQRTLVLWCSLHLPNVLKISWNYIRSWNCITDQICNGLMLQQLLKQNNRPPYSKQTHSDFMVISGILCC